MVEPVLLAQATEAMPLGTAVVELFKLGFACAVAWYLLTRTTHAIEEVTEELARMRQEVAASREELARDTEEIRAELRDSRDRQAR